MQPPARRRLRDNPWWIPPFLGSVPSGVGDRELRLLGFVAFALFAENYDLSMLGTPCRTSATPSASPSRRSGSFTALIRLGALPAFLLIPLADRLGRRWLLLASIIGVSVGSLLTAFSPTAAWFVTLQVVTRTFIIAASVTTFVIIAEEFPAEHRGWGIGILGAVGAIGYGFGAALYALVEVLPFGWRALYVVGGTPVLALPLFRRGIHETRRFQAHRAQQTSEARALSQALGMLRPLLELAREHPQRAIAIALLGALATAGHATSFQFVSDFLQRARGWTPQAFAGMTIAFGAVGIIGNVAAGRLGDRYGRRAVGLFVLVLFPLFAWGFYRGPASLVVAPWICMVFASMATTVILRALTAEVFPTSTRGAAGGALSLCETIGAAGGLFLLSAVMIVLPDRSQVIPLLSLLTALSAGLLFLLPETRQRELETLSEEPSMPRPAAGSLRAEGDEAA